MAVCVSLNGCVCVTECHVCVTEWLCVCVSKWMGMRISIAVTE